MLTVKFVILSLGETEAWNYDDVSIPISSGTLAFSAAFLSLKDGPACISAGQRNIKASGALTLHL